jgi:hypothetical protein
MESERNSNGAATKVKKARNDMPLLGPELALGIPRCSAREAIKNWTECLYHSA